MEKVRKARRKSDSRRDRFAPYPLPSHSSNGLKDVHQKKKCSKAQEKKEWEDATCSICLEYPHKAVLLLCSSYDKGCRPYMCATSIRYSNCLEQYTSTQIVEPSHGSMDKSELLCPLGRGQVKDWMVVKPARKYLNAKRRTCMQDNCSFVGTYKELRKHARAEHPGARPREVDHLLAEEWEKLEREKEREDVISIIRSTMPGAIIRGDYVVMRRCEGGYVVMRRREGGRRLPLIRWARPGRLRGTSATNGGG